MHGALYGPLLIEHDRRHGARLRVGIERKLERVRGHIVVRCELDFDIRRRDPTSDPENEALRNPWHIHVAIHFCRIVPVPLIPLQQLIAEPAPGGHVPVIAPVQIAKPKSPIDMVSLYGVGLALHPEHRLLQHHGFGNDPIRGGLI